MTCILCMDYVTGCNCYKSDVPLIVSYDECIYVLLFIIIYIDEWWSYVRLKLNRFWMVCIHLLLKNQVLIIHWQGWHHISGLVPPLSKPLVPPLHGSWKYKTNKDTSTKCGVLNIFPFLLLHSPQYQKSNHQNHKFTFVHLILLV